MPLMAIIRRASSAVGQSFAGGSVSWTLLCALVMGFEAWGRGRGRV